MTLFLYPLMLQYGQDGWEYNHIRLNIKDDIETKNFLVFL